MTPHTQPQNNALLASLPAAEWARWQPQLEWVAMPLGQVIYESGRTLSHVFFPTTSIVSLLYVMESGASAEAPKDWQAEGGRGLRLVELVADEWGVVDLPEGKQVWFRLDVGEGWPHRASCPCGGEDLEHVRLESGRYAVATPGPWDHQD